MQTRAARVSRLTTRAHDAVTLAVVGLVVVDPGRRLRRSTDWQVWLPAMQAVEGVMRRVTRPLVVGAVATGAAAAAAAASEGRRGQAEARAVAALLDAVAVRVTLVCNDPVCSRVRDWQPAQEPPDWHAQWRRWERGHRVRRVLWSAAAAATLVSHRL